MSRRKTRIAGAPLPRSSNIIPVCSSCKTNEQVQRNEAGEWFCLKCNDDHWREFINARAGDHTASGIVLPSGVKDPAKQNPSYRDVYPNRAARRRAARH